MSLPKVSVIIPNYNYAKYIPRTLDSVLAQTYGPLEIIVVDDGSKDDSLAILAGYGARVNVIRQQNKGVAQARNTGAAAAAGEYLAFLDADDIWLPEKITRQMAKFLSDKDIGLVHCAMHHINLQEEIVGENRNGQEGWLAEEFLRLKKGVVIGAGSTGVVTRAAFDAVGGFDTRLSTAADWEFCYRIAQRYKIGFVPEALALYRLHNSNMHANVGAMEHDMLIGFAKAFADTQAPVQKIRAECYGNFYMMLAGSYFHAKNYPATLRSAFASLWYNPRNLKNYLSRSRKK